MREAKIKSVQILGFGARAVRRFWRRMRRRLPQCARPSARWPLFVPVLRQLPLRKRKIARELFETCFLIFGEPDWGGKEPQFTVGIRKLDYKRTSPSNGFLVLRNVKSCFVSNKHGAVCSSQLA